MFEASIDVFCGMSFGAPTRVVLSSKRIDKDIWQRSCPNYSKGRTFSVSAIGFEPYIKYTPKGAINIVEKEVQANLCISGMAGADIDLVNVLSETLDFKWTLKYEKAWTHGFKNGTLTMGTYHSVSNNISEIGIGHCIPDAGK